MTTKLKNLTQSSWVVLDSESRTSDATIFKCLRMSCINKSWEKLWRSRVPRTLMMLVKIKFSAEFVGVTRMIRPILSLSPASVRDQWVSSISSASSPGFLLRSRRNHQVLKTKMWGHSTGRDSSARFAKWCIHTLSKLDLLFTRLLIRQTRLPLRPRETISCWSQCLSTRILREISICLPLLLNRLSSNLVEVMNHKCVSTISV